MNIRWTVSTILPTFVVYTCARSELAIMLAGLEMPKSIRKTECLRNSAGQVTCGEPQGVKQQFE